MKTKLALALSAFAVLAAAAPASAGSAPVGNPSPCTSVRRRVCSAAR